MEIRDPVFKQLSEDHQVLLAHATALENAAKYPPSHQAQVGRPFVAYWLDTVLDHLDDEERVALPRFADDTMSSKIRLCSMELREQVEWLRFALLDPGGPGPVLRVVAETLRQHVRLCEWELFDGLQEALKAPGLAQVGKDLENHRAARRARAQGLPVPPQA